MMQLNDKTRQESMNTARGTQGILEDVKVGVNRKLSALWTTLMFLYIYADILSFFRPGQLNKIMAGRMGPFEANQGTLLLASATMIIPACMVFLSLVLKPAVNRWANIILGLLYALVNISNLIGETWAYYLLFSAVELVIVALIVILAWKWPANYHHDGNLNRDVTTP